MSYVTVVAAEAAHVALPMPTWAYPVIAVVLFIALGVVVWSFREVASRHSSKADAYAAAHGATSGHGGH